MVKVVITDKKGLVQSSGGGTHVQNNLDLHGTQLKQVGLLQAATQTQTLDAHKNFLSCSTANVLLIDAGGSARTGAQLATGSYDGQMVNLANVSNADSETVTFSPNTGSSQINSVKGALYKLVPLQAGGGIFGPLMWYKNGWMQVSGTTIAIASSKVLPS